MRFKFKLNTIDFSFISIIVFTAVASFKVKTAFKISNDLTPPVSKYIGCYDSWERSTGHYFGTFYNSRNISTDFCRNTCHLLEREGRRDFVILVKQRFCACVHWENFVNARVEDKYCSLPCSDDQTTESCGGNYGLSAYCDNANDSCTTFEPPPIEDLYESTPEIPDVTEPEIFYACANCSICYGTYYPRFDYIPRNTPEACIEFCGRRINYWANGNKIRNPSPLAAVGWTRGKAPGLSIPSCACLEWNAPLEVLHDGECDQECPGDEEQTCGSIEKFKFSVYRTGIPDTAG